MARDQSFHWSEEALEDFKSFDPADVEIDSLDKDMASALEQRIEMGHVDYTWSVQDHILFRSGRFAVQFWFPESEEEAEITTVFLWPTEGDAASQSPVFGGKTPRWKTIEILYATDRKWLGDDLNTYGSDRGPLTFGSCEVAIPACHRIGSLETPSLLRLDFGNHPTEHVTVINVAKERDTEAFFTKMANRVSGSERREALVFVHGYNVTFQDAVRRTAQIAFDLNFDGAPVLYSWPSVGRGTAYRKDETNVLWTVSHFRKFLASLSEKTGATTIHLIAHSIGNRALTEVLKDWVRPAEGSALFSHIVLTAPDIDAETFKHLAPSVCNKAEKVTLYFSAFDKALMLSKKFHGGYSRAGEVVVIVSGLDTIDASAVNTSFAGHSHFAESRSVIEDIYWLLRNQPVGERFGIRKEQAPDGIYYVFRP
jgi:esterase/lipase superfamily enzyme